jgi:TRAP-type mannitol/chloroaromatic compound transport system permease small subunit
MLNKLIHIINNINEFIGRTIAWCLLAMVAITFLNVVLRYGFSLGSIAVQESVIYLHAFVFMLALAYTYKHDAHVRVDVFYANFSATQKAWVDLLGTVILLLPFCFYVAISSWEYTHNSWKLWESSAEAGGLPFVYILKTLIPVMPLLLALQAIAVVLTSIQTLTKQHS